MLQSALVPWVCGAARASGGRGRCSPGGRFRNLVLPSAALSSGGGTLGGQACCELVQLAQLVEPPPVPPSRPPEHLSPLRQRVGFPKPDLLAHRPSAKCGLSEQSSLAPRAPSFEDQGTVHTGPSSDVAQAPPFLCVRAPAAGCRQAKGPSLPPHTGPGSGSSPHPEVFPH